MFASQTSLADDLWSPLPPFIILFIYPFLKFFGGVGDFFQEIPRIILRSLTIPAYSFVL